jgi:hypothetical protein
MPRAIAGAADHGGVAMSRRRLSIDETGRRIRLLNEGRLSHEQFIELIEGETESPPNPTMAFDAKPKWMNIKRNERIQAAYYSERFDTKTLKEMDEFNRKLEERLHTPKDDPEFEQTREKWKQKLVLAAVDKHYPNGTWRLKSTLSIANKIAADFPNEKGSQLWKSVNRALGRDKRDKR